MTWLKKIGQVVLKIVGIAIGDLPILQQLIPQSPNVVAAENQVGALFNIIITAEQMFTAANGPDAKTGSQKIAAATPFIASLLESALAELPAKLKVQDQVKFKVAVTQIASGLADALNACGE